jgi:uncharacterized membrane protein
MDRMQVGVQQHIYGTHDVAQGNHTTSHRLWDTPPFTNTPTMLTALVALLPLIAGSVSRCQRNAKLQVRMFIQTGRPSMEAHAGHYLRARA